MSYTIGQVARLMGIAPSALRFYDKEGLLPLGKRGKRNERIFTEDDINLLSIIEYLRFCGLSIKDVRSFLSHIGQGRESLEIRRRIFEKERSAVQEQITALQKRLARLDFGCWYYEKALEFGSVAPLYGYETEDFLPEHRSAIEEGRTLPLTFARRRTQW